MCRHGTRYKEIKKIENIVCISVKTALEGRTVRYILKLKPTYNNYSMYKIHMYKRRYKQSYQYLS